MDIYSSLLERIRVPQPSMQRFAVISIFEKLRSAPSNLDADSDPGRTAISQCLQSNSSHVVDQSIRELCRHVKEGSIDVSRGLLELQSALEGCDSRFVDVFVKGIGFLVNFSFQKKGSSLRIFDSPEAHPFVKVLSCRTEVHSELVKQVLLFVVRNKELGFVIVCEFLRPFLNFSILRVRFSEASSSFAKHLVSSIASLCCSFSSEAMPFIKLLMGCLKYFPLKNVQDFRDILSIAEYLVEAFVVVLRVVVETGLPTNDALLCGVELLEALLSFYVDLENHSSGKEAIVELSKRVLVVHRELGLQFLPELSSVIVSMFLILTRAEFEHEQLSILKLSVLLLKWKRENESNVARTVCDLSEELLLIFPVINLLSSPSRSVKAAATDLLSILEKILIDSLIARKKIPISQERSPSVSKPESIISRLLQNLWLQDQSSAPSSYFLAFSSDRKTEFRELDGELKSWIPQLREYCIMIAERQKTQLISQSQGNVLTDMPLLLGSVASLMIMHSSLGSYAVDSLAAIGIMDPKVGLPLLLGILFYSRLCYNNQSSSHETVLKLLNILPSLASHSVMIPLVVQTILPMLQRDTKPVLRATAIRLLCKTWEVTDRVFGNLQVVLQSNAFHEFKYDRNTCISMAASIRDVCRKNSDRGVDLILSVSACIESRDPVIQVLGFQSLGHLCEADVVDFYTAWDVIEKHVLDYSVDPIVAHGLCILLRWGALDAEAYSEASKSVLHIIWEVATSRRFADGSKWVKARAAAYESLIHYELEHIKKNIPDFGKRNIEMLIYEDNPDVLNAMEKFEFKIITFEHITRRRVLKEKRVVVNKVEKLLDVFPQVIFRSGKRISNTRELPGAALLCLSFTPKEVHSPGTSEDLQKLHAAYENAVVEIADSLQLSRNILVALLSMQSWKPFMHRWMRAVFMFLDANMPTTVLDKTSKAGDDILKRIRRIAEESVPRSAENNALAIAALCMVLPPSAHTTTVNASKFLLKWLYQNEHEHRQWSAAIGLGLVSSCLHATDRKQKFQIITGLLKVSSNSKSSLVKGACGVGLGFACQDLLTRVEAADGSVSEETDRLMEVNLLEKIVMTYSRIISQLSPSSFDSLQNLCKYFPRGTDDIDAETTGVLLCNNDNYLEEDVWGFAGVIIGLGNSIGSLYRVGGQDAVIRMKALVTSWIPHVNPAVLSSCDSAESEILLSVGACLALPTVVAFCQRVELIDDYELNHLVDGYTKLISELLSVKKSGIFHQSLLMAACIGAGTLLSCILDEGVHSMKSEDIKHLLELCQKSYTDPYPSIVHFGGMLGVVNAMGAGVGTLTHIFPKSSSLQTSSGQKESSYIRGPILSTPVCEPLSTSLMQEMFLVAQDSKDQQLQKYASWAVSFLRHRWCSKDLQAVNKSSQSNQMDSTAHSQSFSEESVVWQLCMWLRDLSNSEDSTIPSVNTVETVLRCLSRAPRLPLSLDWGAIIRCCMRYEDQLSGKLIPDCALKTGSLREQCLQFALAHANQVKPLLFFLDELTDLFRFRTLEVNLQTCLLSSLADLTKVFSGSRLEKLFDDMADYFSSASSYQVYHPDQKTLLRVSFWKGLYRCLDEASNESPEYIMNMEKCMELLFVLLPVLHFDANQRVDQIHSMKEWSEAVRCMGRARRSWLMDILEVPDLSLVRAGYFNDVVKQIQARARLVMTGWIPLIELGKLKAYILNAKFDGIWNVLVDVVAALQCAEGSIKRQWLVDAVEISCITKYPSTVLQFIGLLSSSCCKYMPLLLLDRVSVLSDLPVTLPSLLSHSSWREIAEPVVLNLWTSTQRTYSWAKCLSSGEDVHINHQQPIDKTENSDADYLSCLMHHTCVSLKDYLPFEKQLELANMVVPAKNRVGY